MLDKITYDKERERGTHERKALEKSLDALLVLRGPAFWVPIRGAFGRLGQARAPRRTSRITLMTTDHGPTLLSPVAMSWKKENRFAIIYHVKHNSNAFNLFYQLPSRVASMVPL